MRKALTQGFTTFLRRRHLQRHFARRPLFEGLFANAAVTDQGAASARLDADMLLVARDEPAAASGWFVVGLMTQTLVVHMIRTPKLPFAESRASAPLIVMTALIMLVGLWLPMGPLAGDCRLQALPAAYFAWLVQCFVLFGT